MDRKEYKREWNRKNPDKVKQYRLNSLRRKALAELCKTMPIMKGSELVNGSVATKEGS